MTALDTAQSAKRPPGRRPLAPVATRSERRFWIGLAIAFAVHALIIAGTLISVPRRMGEEKGRPDGVSVVIVDLADLTSRSSVPPQIEQQPDPPGQATPPPQPQTPPPQPKLKQQSVPQPPEQTPPASQLPGVLPMPEPPPETRSPPQPPQKQAMQQQPAPPQPPARKPARPSFDLPDLSLAPGRMQTAATRPAGITRSGENDEFGRNVINALARVMPRLNIQGRVMVRIILNDKGNLGEVKILRNSDDPYLDQNVVFSVKQANFPIPPDASTILDRTFIVTYIYR